MEITIMDGDKLCEVQKEFMQKFPYLKIEFFAFPHFDSEHYLKENMIADTNKIIREIRHIHNIGTISINGHQKVNTLERHFLNNYGINIQVFYKHGNSWLRTDKAEGLTLAELNNYAASISNTDYGRFYSEQFAKSRY